MQALHLNLESQRQLSTGDEVRSAAAEPDPGFALQTQSCLEAGVGFTASWRSLTRHTQVLLWQQRAQHSSSHESGQTPNFSSSFQALIHQMIDKARRKKTTKIFHSHQSTKAKFPVYASEELLGHGKNEGPCAAPQPRQPACAAQQLPCLLQRLTPTPASSQQLLTEESQRARGWKGLQTPSRPSRAAWERSHRNNSR